MKRMVLLLTIVFALVCGLPVSGFSGEISQVHARDLGTAIGAFPENVQGYLRNIASAKNFDASLSAEQAAKLGALLGKTPHEVALALIGLAQAYARPPLSHFKVGAVAIGASGAMYFGSNMEFPGQALSFSIHAEQSATMNAWMHGEKGLQALAISAAPCGYCRQFLHELSTASSLIILLPKSKPTHLSALLPNAFGPDDLGVDGRLMDSPRQELRLDMASEDKLAMAALLAASTSYAPYSPNYSAVALESRDGVIVVGRYAENAAYNPSMSPMEAALCMYNNAGHAFKDIRRAALVQSNKHSADQEDAARAVLRSLAPEARLETYKAVAQ
jgi:cytidine deaminase